MSYVKQWKRMGILQKLSALHAAETYLWKRLFLAKFVLYAIKYANHTLNTEITDPLKYLKETLKMESSCPVHKGCGGEVEDGICKKCLKEVGRDEIEMKEKLDDSFMKAYRSDF